MREKLTIAFAVVILMIMIPYLGTMALTGTVGAGITSIEELDTGKTVSLELDGQYVVLDVEAYLAGILPAAMDGSEEPETWKALAVIERTNIYKRMEGHGNIDQKDLGMTYLTEEEIRELWGERNYEPGMELAEQAILDTAGQTLKYDGEWIDALYHRVSPGNTVSAEELLGEAVPYLVSVASSQDIQSKDYMNISTLSKEEIQELTITEQTEHGYVRKVICNGEELTGEEMQERYGLSSLNFYVEDMGEEYRIVCLGKGHGLGLSLYGANELAGQKKTYEAILQYYYPGTQLDSEWK